ncbi:MAG: EamA family transporter RarD [Candidatus Sumerlaeia bacterium]|nr:EamA family transporter RarD [Candidatus Sumerlaeia bacterium]
MSPLTTEAEKRKGVLYGIAAYAWWGIAPIYFYLVKDVPAFEILAHRVVQSALFLFPLVFFLGARSNLMAVIRDPRSRRYLVGSTLMISINWFVFIYAVQHERVLEASLGYYINPLVSVFLGFLFLGERLRPMQLAAVGLAGIAVLFHAINSVTHVPWIALTLALSFAFYGLLRKRLGAESLVGLTVETTILVPVALAYLTIIGFQGTGVFFNEVGWHMFFLLLAGLVTALPLLSFAAAARRLTLTTMGFLQYIGPTLKFLVAVLLFGEIFTSIHAVTFGIIWSALVLFSIDAYQRSRQRRRDLLYSQAENVLPSNIDLARPGVTRD